MNFNINDKLTVKDLKDRFNKRFGACLSVRDASYRVMSDSATLSSIRAISGNISFDSQTSVETFVKKMLNQCNLHIAVRTPDDCVEVPDPIKIDTVNDLPKKATTDSLYLWYLDEIQKKVKKLQVEIPTTVKGKGLPTRYMPTPAEVQKWNVEWNKRKMGNYQAQENILEDLFQNKYPSNTDYEKVLLKVVVLNEFYSTGIINPRNVAERLCSLAVDKKLESGSMDLVNKIADVTVGKGSLRNFFSFATKYCNFHRPEVYPIYDSFVCKVLASLRNRDGFCEFTTNDLRNAETFKHVIDEFERVYNLIDPDTNTYYDYKKLDRYLWLLGKYYFKKTNKHINNETD